MATNRLPEPEPSVKPVFRSRFYRSGEQTGAYYLSGRSCKVRPPEHVGPRVTHHFSPPSRAKIRRAAENARDELCCFITLTFSPRDLEDWQIDHCLIEHKELVSGGDAYGLPVVRQDFAKWCLRKFRDALNHRVSRQLKVKAKDMRQNGSTEDEISDYLDCKSFRYVWTAELHPDTGAVHFHLLVNKYFPVDYLRRLWGRGRVNVAKINDSEHAANYMSKYVSKDDHSTISGNRYGIGARLRKDAKPMETFKEDDEARELRRVTKMMTDLVEKRGGHVIGAGFGYSLPRPRRSRKYRDKETGEVRETKGVSGRTHEIVEEVFWGKVPF